MHDHSTIVCKQCNTPFHVPLSRIAKANVQFCSSTCRRDWNADQNRTPVIHTCKCCGKEFTAHASAERSYCSKECYWKSKEHKEQRSCPICNKTFETLPSNPSPYCSHKCQGVSSQKRETRICIYCQQEFSVHPHRKDIYCSRSCASQANNAARKVSYPIRTCAKCGKEFEHKRRDTDGKYCSRACSDSVNKNPPAQEWISKPCAYCKNVFQCPPWNQKIEHCSSKCASNHRAQTVHGPAHPLWKDKVEMACEVCGNIRYVKPCLVSRFRACSKNCAGVLSVLSQKRVSSIELKMADAMHKANLYPTPQLPIGKFLADFAFTEQKLVVECDGDYWHSLPKQQVRDRRKDGYLKRVGWRVLRIPEHRILSEIDKCVQDIINSLNNID